MTINESHFNSLGSVESCKNVNIQLTGLLDKYQVLEKYSQTDALFFPSFDESYGLPLVEAMKLGKIIICSDKPFARWLCGNEAIYFDPNDYESAENAIRLAHGKWNSGWKPDWTDSLSKIPENWDAYFFEFQIINSKQSSDKEEMRVSGYKLYLRMKETTDLDNQFHVLH